MDILPGIEGLVVLLVLFGLWTIVNLRSQADRIRCTHNMTHDLIHLVELLLDEKWPDGPEGAPGHPEHDVTTSNTETIALWDGIDPEQE